MWRTIGRFPQYEASSQGTIRNKVSRHVLKQYMQERTGYFHLTLYQDGKAMTVDVHKIVAITFFGPCPMGMEVNHKNGMKIINSIDNLEYVTHHQNDVHAIAHGLRSGRIVTSKEASMIVGMKQEGMSGYAIARRVGRSPSVIDSVLHRGGGK